MKKSIALILAVLMMAAMLLTGCTTTPATTEGGETDNVETENGENVVEETPAVKENIVLTTGGNTGTYYGYGMAMSTILSEKTGIAFDVQPSGASKANIQAIQLGDANMAVVQNDVMYYAYTGTDLFTGEQTQDFAAMAVLYPELCQIIASKESGIKTVADLAGKRVSVGDAGSGVEFNAKQILEAYGIDMNTGIEKQNLGFGPSADALKDGKIDAFFCVAGIPTTAVTDLAISTDITVVEVEDDKFEELSAKYGFYTQQTVPAGTYNGVDADVKTVAVMATYIVDKDLSEDTVYAITKAIFENKDAIAAVHVKGEELDAAAAVQGIPAEVPMHAGAVKYFKEAGVLDAEGNPVVVEEAVEEAVEEVVEEVVEVVEETAEAVEEAVEEVVAEEAAE